MSAASLDKIMRAATELGFRPSWSARTLNNSSGGFTGIVVADLYSPALAPISIGASRLLQGVGGEVLLSSASMSEPGADAALESSSIAFLGDLRPSRLLIVGAVADMSMFASLASQVPTVVAGSRDVDIPAIAEVFTDDDIGLDLTIEHLLALGHERIAHIAGIGPVGRARESAYRRSMVAHGLADHMLVEQADFEERAGYRATRALLAAERPPTAVTTAGDLAAIGALAAIAEIDAQVAVVGYGNTAASAFHLVGLTSVDPRNQMIGERAAEVFLSPDSTGAQRLSQIRVAPTLVVRSSSRPFVESV